MKTVTFVRSSPPEARIVASGLKFQEGPIAMADGSVLATEIAGRRLTRVLRDGKIEHVVGIPGGPDNRAASITCSGTGQLMALGWSRPGLRLAFPRSS